MLEVQYHMLFKRCKMQNLIGPIVKNAEIFHKNIFIPFFQVVLGSKLFYGTYVFKNIWLKGGCVPVSKIQESSKIHFLLIQIRNIAIIDSHLPPSIILILKITYTSLLLHQFLILINSYDPNVSGLQPPSPTEAYAYGNYSCICINLLYELFEPLFVQLWIWDK